MIKSMSKGFAFVELLVAVGIAAIFSSGIALVLQNTMTSHARAESQANSSQYANELHATLLNKTISSPVCSSLLQLMSSFTAVGKVPVRFNLGTVIYVDGAMITSGLRPFKVNKIYLAESELVADNGTQKTYVSTLFLEAGAKIGNDFRTFPKKDVVTVTLNVNTSGGLIDCNMNLAQATNQSNCQTIHGMHWNSATLACEQDIQKLPSNDFVECPGGTQLDASLTCVPSANTCNSGQLPQKFDEGIVTSCASVPSGIIIVGQPVPTTLSPTTIPPGGAPIADVNPAPTTVFPTISPVAVPVPTSVPQPSQCSTGTAIGQTNLIDCSATNSICSTTPSFVPAPKTTCSTELPAPYTAPNFAINPPVSNQLPATPTCVCSSYRIDTSAGQYCLAIQPRDNDWKIHIEACVGGNLVHVGNELVHTKPLIVHSERHRGQCLGAGPTQCTQFE